MIGNNTRPIILLSIIRKIISTITLERIRPAKENKISSSQAFYRKGRSIEVVWTLKLYMAKAICSQWRSYVRFRIPRFQKKMTIYSAKYYALGKWTIYSAYVQNIIFLGNGQYTVHMCKVLSSWEMDNIQCIRAKYYLLGKWTIYSAYVQSIIFLGNGQYTVHMCKVLSSWEMDNIQCICAKYYLLGKWTIYSAYVQSIIFLGNGQYTVHMCKVLSSWEMDNIQCICAKYYLLGKWTIYSAYVQSIIFLGNGQKNETNNEFLTKKLV